MGAMVLALKMGQGACVWVAALGSPPPPSPLASLFAVSVWGPPDSAAEEGATFHTLSHGAGGGWGGGGEQLHKQSTLLPLPEDSEGPLWPPGPWPPPEGSVLALCLPRALSRSLHVPPPAMRAQSTFRVPHLRAPSGSLVSLTEGLCGT